MYTIRILLVSHTVLDTVLDIQIKYNSIRLILFMCYVLNSFKLFKSVKQVCCV